MADRECATGEFGLIESIKLLCAALPTNNFEGIGDDCAVLPIDEAQALVFTQDMLVERVHFLRDATTPYELAMKSLAVNLSDVAAMGATPTATLLSLSIPAELNGEWIADFMRGYRDMSAEFGVALVGGDTTASKGDFVINITAIGLCARSRIRRRSDAKVGDVIATTGRLGASGAGLEDILSGDLTSRNAAIHRSPQPQVAQGHLLAHECEGVHAMMDISDGVASDLRHILRASGVGAELQLRDIPIAEGATLRQALSSGEDYELLVTIAAEEFDHLQSLFTARFGKPLYPIGVVVEGDDIVWRDGEGVSDVDFRGFTHY